MRSYKLFLAFFLCLVANFLHSQDLPVTQIRISLPLHFQNNQVYFNPAFAGSEGKRQFGFTGAQGVSTASGRPGSGIAYYHAPSGAREVQTGIGVVTSYNNLSPYSRGKFGFVYARGKQLTKNLRVAAGLQLNGKFLSVDYEAWRQLNPLGKNIVSDDSDVWPDLDAGIWIDAHPFFIGASVVNIMQRTYEFKSDASRQDMREALLNAGFKIRFAEGYNLKPSILIQKGFAVENPEITYNATAMLKFLIIGATYQASSTTESPWIFNGGLNFSDKVYFILAASVPEKNFSEVYKNRIEGNLRIQF
jgi:type IX secretion system PorP/SprF family membrane protein